MSIFVTTLDLQVNARSSNRRVLIMLQPKDSSKPDLRFDNRVVIVTGAGGGLGKSHALEFARRGASVLVNDLGGAVDGTGSSTSAAQKVVDEIVALGGTAVANHDSVATWEGAQAIVQAALDNYGHVDVLVNNAGILRDKAFHKMDNTMIDPVIDVHLKGTLYVSTAAFRLMREQGYGRIINTSSASGLFGNFGQANYGAAKAGIAGFTRVLAIEGGKFDFRANAIAPLADTRMTEGTVPMKFDAKPESVTAVVVFLAHESCQETGSVFSVGGNRVAKIITVETEGVVFPEVTAEAVRDFVPQISFRNNDYAFASLGDAVATTEYLQREIPDKVLVGM